MIDFQPPRGGLDQGSVIRPGGESRPNVSELRDLLEHPEAPRPIEHRTVAATPAAGIQATIDREDVLAWWRGALGELQATLGAQAPSPTGPSGGLYASEIFQHGRGEATVFIPTEEPVKRSAE